MRLNRRPIDRLARSCRASLPRRQGLPRLSYAAEHATLGGMTILLADDEVVILRRTFYLVRLEEQANLELVQLCLRRDLIQITKTEAESAKRKVGEPGSEEEKQQRLNDAVASWAAEKLTHPILETRFWVSSMSFPFEAAGSAVADLNKGLNDLFAQKAESIAEWAGGPIVIDAPVAGITANLVMEPIAEPLTKLSKIFWTAGLVVAFATGNIALAIGCAKGLAREAIKEAVTKAIGNLLDPAPAPTTVTDSHATARGPDATDEGPATTGNLVLGREAGQGRVSPFPGDSEKLRRAIDLASNILKVTEPPPTPRERPKAADNDEALTKHRRAVDGPTNGMTAL